MLNRKVTQSSHSKPLRSQAIYAANVRFFTDALKDEFTLVSRTIADSPHYNMVSKILDGEMDIEGCDYVIREARGLLDGRFELSVADSVLKSHIKATQATRKIIIEGKYSHPRVFEFDGYYYALDGKHRLAVAAYLSKELVCDVVPVNNVFNTSYIQSIKREMGKRKERYSLNLKLLESIERGISK